MYLLQDTDLHHIGYCHAPNEAATSILAAYFLLGRFRERCSARKISKTLKIQYRTALRLLHSVRHAMLRAVDQNATFAFWIPSKPTDHPILRKAKLRLLKRAELFIRKFYRRTSEYSRKSYFSEFWFRSNNANNPLAAIDKLITSGSSTIYSINEYRSF